MEVEKEHMLLVTYLRLYIPSLRGLHYYFVEDKDWLCIVMINNGIDANYREFKSISQLGKGFNHMTLESECFRSVGDPTDESDAMSISSVV